MRYRAAWIFSERSRSASSASSSAIRARAAASSSSSRCGRARAVVTLVARSTTLEVSLAVPRVDGRVVRVLLDAGGVQVVVDDVVAEDLARGSGALELADCLPQRARHARHTGRDVAVADVLVGERQIVLDPVQAGTDHCRIRQVRVHVATGEPVLDVERGAVADEPEPG